MHGLGTAALTQVQMARVDAFRMRGLRQILTMRHPYMGGAKTNQRVMEVANAFRCSKGGCILTCSECYEDQRLQFGDVLRALPEDPVQGVTFAPNCGALLGGRAWIGRLDATLKLGKRCSAVRSVTP